MTSGLFYLVLALGLSCGHSFVHWKILEIETHHEFFTSRALKEELLTINAAENAVESLTRGLNESLNKVVDYQHRELQNALRQSAGTYNEDCVRGLSSYMTKAIDEVISVYNDCTEEIPQRLSRVNKYLTSDWAKYNATYEKTIDDVNHCVSNYPNNKDSRELIEKCIKVYEDMYDTKANLVQRKYNNKDSPAMTQFRGTVLQCIGNAFDSIISKGYQFLEKLKCCSNSTAYLHWEPVNNTLREQVEKANQLTQYQVIQMDNEIRYLYTYRLLSAEKFLYYQEKEGYFLDLLYSLLSSYFYTVNITGIHNFGDLHCVNVAKTALHNIAKNGGSNLLYFDTQIRENTTQVVSEITHGMKKLNNQIPSIGNLALLKCFSEGYIFAPNTISDCFQLAYTEFFISYRYTLLDIQDNLLKLDKYLDYFWDRYSYHWFFMFRELWFLEAETVLYNLQRCLYKSSATIYPVTTTPWGTTEIITVTFPTKSSKSEAIYSMGTTDYPPRNPTQ